MPRKNSGLRDMCRSFFQLKYWLYKYCFRNEKVQTFLQKTEKAAGKKTPKSAPPVHIKRKKLEEEIDEQLSDDEFEVGLARDNCIHGNSGFPLDLENLENLEK